MQEERGLPHPSGFLAESKPGILDMVLGPVLSPKPWGEIWGSREGIGGGGEPGKEAGVLAALSPGLMALEFKPH